MNKLQVTNHGLRELGHNELKNVTGGGDVTGYLRCVATTLTSGGGGIKSFVLGCTIFGMSRMLGVMVGCSSL